MRKTGQKTIDKFVCMNGHLVDENDGAFQLNKKAYIPPPSANWCMRSSGGAQLPEVPQDFLPSKLLDWNLPELCTILIGGIGGISRLVIRLCK